MRPPLLADPLSQNYSGQDGAGGAVIYEHSPNDGARLIGELLRQKMAERKMRDHEASSDLTNIGALVGKAWERDQDYFSGRLKEYATLAKKYHYGKGLTDAQRDQLQLQKMEAAGRLVNDVNQSSKDQANYVKYNSEISRNPDSYDPQDIQGLKDFYESGYKDRNREFAPEKGSEISLLKYLQGLKVPMKVDTVKVKDENGKLVDTTKEYARGEDIDALADLELRSDNKNMRAYKKSYMEMHPAATTQDMKNDFIAAWKSSNPKFRSTEIYYDAPLDKSDPKPKMINDGLGVKVKDAVYSYEIMPKPGGEEGVLTINKSGTDIDNRPLTWEKGVDEKTGKPTGEGIDGSVRAVRFPGGGVDPYIEIFTKQPIEDPKRKGKVTGYKKVVEKVPATVYNMQLIAGNYGLDPNRAKDMMEDVAQRRWEARKIREGATVNRPALTPDQRGVRGVSSNNKVGKKPRL